MRIVVLTSSIILLGLAASADAQPYVYVATQGTAASAGLYFLPLSPRLVTFDSLSGQAIASLNLTGCWQDLFVLPDVTLTVKPDGSRVYVACAAAHQTGVVLAIDPFAKQIVGTATYPVPPTAIAVTPDGARLLVTLPNSTVAVVDTASLGTIALVPVSLPTAVGVLPEGTRAYIAGTIGGGAQVSVLDLGTLSVLHAIAIGGNAPVDVAIPAAGSPVVVLSRFAASPPTPQAGFLSLIRTSDDTATGSISIPGTFGDTVFHVVVNSTGTRAYVPVMISTDAANPDGVRVVDLTSGTVTGTLSLQGPVGIAISPTDDRLIVSTRSYTPPEGLVTIDLTTRQSLSSGPVVGGPNHLAMAPAGPAVSPDPCTYALGFAFSGLVLTKPVSTPAGSSGRLSVIALPDRCTWTVQSSAPWITFGAEGSTGTDTVAYTIAPNTTGVSRTATITVATQTLTVTQAGCTNPIIHFERPMANTVVSQPFRISGWAIDTCSSSGTGLQASSAGDPQLNYGLVRPDVAAAYGAQFVNSGFDFVNPCEQPPGPQDVGVGFTDVITGNPVSAVVRVNLLPTARPFGALDTPADGATVSGEMPLTGWVLDDFGIVGNILVFRSAVTGETPTFNSRGRVFVGVASRVRGTRPDVQAAFPGYPDNDRAGFGLMVLTNMLPNGGNGTFTFSIDVADLVHPAFTLASVTVNVNNATSLLPFGTIDTPTQGQTVSGVVTNFGWALTPQPASIPIDGSTIDVVIDGGVVGHPVYNNFRSDIATLFPSYANSSGAIGYYVFDTRTMTNGVHTIAWVVRDNRGHAQGMGSRFFTVQNP